MYFSSVPHPEGHFQTACLKGEANANLRGEGNAYRGTGPEEVAESAGGNEELVGIGDGLGLRASEVEAEGGGVGKTIYRDGQRGDVGDVVGAGIVAIEEVEEFYERGERITLASDRTRNAEIHLDVRGAAKLVERGLHAVNDG